MASVDWKTQRNYIIFFDCGPHKILPRYLFWLNLIKQHYRRTIVGSLQDIATVVSRSSVVNKTQLVGAQDGSSIVPIFDWGSFFDSTTKRIKGIKKFQHFRFSCQHPGAVFVKTNCNDVEKKYTLVKSECEHTLRDDFPATIPPPGLSVERQQYLYEKIREFCPEEVN